MRKYYIFLLILFCLSCNIFRGAKTLAKAEYNINMIENEIVFSINDVFTGDYALSFWLEPIDINVLRQSHIPISFKYSVEVHQGNKRMEKSFSFSLEGATIGSKIQLYSIPKDFSNKEENIKVIIKDIVFDNTFLTYYKSIGFGISRLAFFR
jgi:hypothetical protein